MEDEFYNLVVKGNDLKIYARIFQELAVLCPNMVPNTKKLMEAFIWGLPKSIEGNVTASKPQTLEEDITITQRLMYQDQLEVNTLTVIENETPTLKEPKKTLEDEFADLHLKRPVLEVLAHVSMYDAFLDKYIVNLELGENGSEYIQSIAPEKMKDPGLFILPCRLGDSKPFETLANLGSCVNLLPLKLFKELKVGLLEETDDVLGLADGTKSYPVGIVRNVEESEDLIENPINWNKPPKEGDSAWQIRIELIEPDGEKFDRAFQSILTNRRLSLKENANASDTGTAPKQQQQVIPQTTAISNIKLPILKKEEYDIWAMEMEHYLEYIDNEVWK
ncbi:hypothetical protein Tco_0453283, partial [Tanacetum coccineum]